MPSNALGPVILDIAGLELQQEEKEILLHPQTGGLILFSRNFESSEQLLALTRTVREIRPQLLISVDHEGGRVQRFKQDFTALPTMQSLGHLYAQSTEDAPGYATELGWLMAAELAAHGVDLSFAPVLDLDDCRSDIIGDRAFSPDPSVTCVLAESFIDGMHAAGMSSTGKHFPGHGGVKEDSHRELPVDERGLKTIEEHDLVPFSRLMGKLDALMSAHILFSAVDTQLVSYSSVWLKSILRERLGFKGLVFSDDLAMEGAADGGAFIQRAERAMTAGCDVVLVCNHRRGAIEVIEGLEKKCVPIPEHGLEKLRRSDGCTLDQLKRNSRWARAVRVAQSLIN